LRGANDVKDKNSKPRELQYVKNGRYVVIPDCGHMLNMERPDDFNRILLDFLTDTAEPRY
jgi:pimeloyl-ACP methyl ester carboxylesterase